jgi:hypothetical protein
MIGATFRPSFRRKFGDLSFHHLFILRSNGGKPLQGNDHVCVAVRPLHGVESVFPVEMTYDPVISKMFDRTAFAGNAEASHLDVLPALFALRPQVGAYEMVYWYPIEKLCPVREKKKARTVN